MNSRQSCEKWRARSWHALCETRNNVVRYDGSLPGLMQVTVSSGTSTDTSGQFPTLQRSD